MIILGLTGSIAMGKSTVAKMFQDLGIAVHDADQAVHALYQEPAFIAKLKPDFGAAIEDEKINRQKLGQLVLGNPAAMAKLEALVHPAVHEKEAQFLEQARRDQRPLVVLDIPLLFETGGDARCDYTVVVSADAQTQRARVLARPGMSEEKFAAILAKQMPDAEKRKRADFIISTNESLESTRAEVISLVDDLTKMSTHRESAEKSV